MKAAFFLAIIAVIVALAAATTYEEYSKIVNEVNSKQNLWTAELNTQILDDFTAIRNMLGDLSVGSNSNQLPRKTSGWAVEVDQLPENFLAAEQWPQCASMMKTVHDQSSCGSCWAVSVAAAASERHCIKTGTSDVFLSARDLMSCCSSCGYGCEGGWPSAAWSYIAQSGLVTGSPSSTNSTLCVRYPFLSCQHHVEGQPQCSDYDFSTPKCQKTCDDDSSWPLPYAQDKIKFSRAYSVSGEANIMQELVTNGPMSISYTVYQDFMAYKSGIYKHTTGSSLGGHAVTLEGYGVENGVKYWLIKNNWNPSWGENGYFRIVRGQNDCGVEGGANCGSP